MRLIDAEGIRIKPEFMHDVCGMAMIRVEDIVRILNEQPTIHPKRGRWESVPLKRARICSCCGHDEPYKFADDDTPIYNFCPHCGADMREVTT